MRLAVAALLLAAASFSSPALAAEKSNVYGPPGLGTKAAPKATEPAVRVARLMLPRQQWDRIWEVMADSQRQMIQQVSDGREEAEKAVSLLMRKLAAIMPYEDMIDLQAGLLQKYYTVDELKQLEKFYNSPLGQKSLKLAPEIMQDAMGAMQERIVREMPKIMAEIEAEVGGGAHAHD